MRLLDVESLAIREFHGANIPPYAILSHVWGPDEVSFQDMQSFGLLRARWKPGFSKIEGCCRQAKRDGFKWVWIDSCCIDKSSSAELSEAINSMYQWYKSSDRCYVILADVGGQDVARSDGLTESLWFTRGWTLQELLAPKYLLFFNRDWEVCGHILKTNEPTNKKKASMPKFVQLVSTITGIPTRYLTGNSALSQACIAQRMHWACRRRTTRAEDRAYSLLGLFNISMPILYGEGLQKAFARLQSEIMKEHPDQSILAWNLTGRTSYRLFAESPDDFQNSASVAQLQRGSNQHVPWSSFQLTNLGMSINLPVITNLRDLAKSAPGTVVEASLKCVVDSKSQGNAPRQINLSLILIDQDSNGSPIFICRRPPTWIYNTRKGKPTNIIISRNDTGTSRTTPKPSPMGDSRTSDLVVRGLNILAAETRVDVEYLDDDESLLDDIGVDSLLTITIGARIYEELGVATFGDVAECKTVGEFRKRLEACSTISGSVQGLGVESALVQGLKAWRRNMNALSHTSVRHIPRGHSILAKPTKHLFIAPDATGASVDWTAANFMPQEWAVFELVSPFFGMPHEYDCGIEEISSRLLEEVRRHRPKGPYSLAGWSTGGIIAYEMAQQLMASGDKVEHLFIMDDFSPHSESTQRASIVPLPSMSRTYIEHYPRGLDDDHLAQIHVHASITAIQEYIPNEHLAQLLRESRPDVWILCSVNTTTTDSVELPKHGAHLLFPGRVNNPSGANGWDKYFDLSTVNVVSLPCDHYEMLTGKHGDRVVHIIRQAIRSSPPDLSYLPFFYR
ncbi:conidial yellow pigment biosynthesis polyketide synthase [Podospora fimiseda]|uniref:Conidial yellow pigment biosynthesis polyketide synthase n=1 Tax=Podospora fimiseda TaxID=252190 RepID=A0AAN7GP02_9PEZI|nr:conidial yellow pigment biosynthesis polyketide synthase [Podospora fimiseda]